MQKAVCLCQLKVSAGLLLGRGVAKDGTRILSVESVEMMTSDQLKKSLSDIAFNTHVHDVAACHPSVGVGAPGQGGQGRAGQGRAGQGGIASDAIFH